MEPTNQNPQVMHDFTQSKTSSSSVLSFASISIFLAVIILGVTSGYLLSLRTKNVAVQGTSTGSAISTGTIYGSNDTTTFKDTAEGVLQKGGIKGEGQFHLVRPGGDSQNVYLTSSTLDLSQFVGKKIKVWGATQTAQYAGWLMEAGRVQVE